MSTTPHWATGLTPEEISRRQWIRSAAATGTINGDGDSGSLMRIADALEKLNENMVNVLEVIDPMRRAKKEKDAANCAAWEEMRAAVKEMFLRFKAELGCSLPKGRGEYEMIPDYPRTLEDVPAFRVKCEAMTPTLYMQDWIKPGTKARAKWEAAIAAKESK